MRSRYHPSFTPRQEQVLSLLARGYTNPEIATELGISLDGAKWHVREILSRLGVSSREEAAEFWRARPGWVYRNSRVLVGLLAGKLGVGLGLTAGTVAAAVFGAVLFARFPEGDAGASLGKVAFVQNGDLWVKSLPAGKPTLVTHGPNGSSPIWSPSGQWILTGDKVVRDDGSSARTVPGCASWSATSDELICARTGSGIVVERADGRDQRMLPGTATANSALSSPNGRFIAYVTRPLPSASPAPAGQDEELWVISWGGHSNHVLLNPQQLRGPTGEVTMLGWVPDSKRILVATNPSLSQSLAADGLRIYSIDVNDGSVEALPDPALPFLEFFALPTGRSELAYTAGDSRLTWSNKWIDLVDLSSGVVRRVSPHGEAAIQPSVAQATGVLAYSAATDAGPTYGGTEASGRLAERRIFLAGPDSNAARLLDDLTSSPPSKSREERPLLSSNGKHVLFVRVSPDATDAASLWLADLDERTQTKVADISIPLRINEPSLSFGAYGGVRWNRYFAWWQPAASGPP